ncbi:MAG: uncharacterized protein PWP76_289 [Candidatus Diapherotrites archaeon]|nr:uncharacterized protein [Candidatus Diapherotrites archaeon]MDN5366758.1 uncharacterized protein [Candidatus Diapherotrites archaeon]
MESVEEKWKRYVKITEEALKRVKVVDPLGEKLLDMCRRYVEDSKYFAERGDYATALAAISYAHAWIDVGTYIGLLKGDDDQLFILGDQSGAKREV